LDKNIVTLTGTITNLANRCTYIPNPIITLDLQVFRKKQKQEVEPKFDLVRVVMFNNEDFNQKYKNGDRIKVVGELQSRNYSVDNYEVPEYIEKAAANYLELFEQFPCKKNPTGKRREEIDWSCLINTGLLASVPKDSLYIENGEKSTEIKDKYVYAIDKDMIVYKATQHVAYEVLVEKRYEKIDNPLDIHIGDINKVELIGKVTKRNSYKNRLSINVRTQSGIIEGRVFNNNAFLWEEENNIKSNKIQVGHRISLRGRLQSRNYVKTIRIRKITPSGIRKRLDIQKTFTTREVSISSFLMTLESNGS
jgi:hypothetical protein